MRTVWSTAVLLSLAAVLLSCGRADDIRCGPGTVEVEAICVPDGAEGSDPTTRPPGGTAGVTCGDGTIEQDGLCLPDPDRCGEGLDWNPAQGRCVLTSASCGTGTVLATDGVTCVTSPDLCGAGTAPDAASGTCTLAPETCGPGATFDAASGTCLVSADVCGTRTRWEEAAGRCVPSDEVCGPGTRWLEFAGGCLPDEEPGSRCGTHTIWDEERLVCMPDPALCAEGTVANDDGNCVPAEEVCGDGTAWDADAGRCVLAEGLCAGGTAFDEDAGACLPTDGVCGDGTAWNAATSRCEAQGVTCGPGTVLDDDSGRCVVDATGCGAGTALDVASGTCVPAAEACGNGTEWDAGSGTCVFARTGCLEGTVFDEDLLSCVPSEDVCGPGTTWIPDRRVCIAGEYVVGGCEEPPTLEIPAGNIILSRGSCFLVEGNVTIGGDRSFTVEPGVTLIFAQAASLLVGNRATAPTNPLVRMVGTEEEPIRLMGTQPTPGWWRGLAIGQTNSPDNLLEHVIIEHAGDQPWDDGVSVSRAGLLLDTNFYPMRIGLRNVTVSDTTGYGISMRTGRTPAGLCSQVRFMEIEAFENITSTRNTRGPLNILADLVGHIDEGSSFSGNDDDRVTVYSAPCRSINREQTWIDPGVPYHVVNDLILSAAGNLTMEDGIELHFTRDSSFDIRGRIHIRGTEERPVIMRSEEFAPASWRGVRIADNNRPENMIEHLTIIEAGNTAWGSSPRAGLVIDPVGGPVATGLRHVTVEGSAGSGLVIRPGSVIVHAFEANTFTDNADRPVVIPAQQAGVLDEASSYAGNATDTIAIAGIFSGDITLRNLDVPWEATEELRVRNSATLTIEAGTHILFRLNTWLRVGEINEPGFIRILGSLDAPVIMEGTTPVAGWWRGLFMGNSLNPLNEINHLTVRHGGSEQWTNQIPAANVHLTVISGNARARINGLRIEDGLGAGLFIASAFDLLSCSDVTFDNVDPPVIGDVAHFEANCGALDD